MTTGPRASPAKSIRRVMSPSYPTHAVIRAVFFDWGNTLVAWEFDPELFVEGHVRGLDAFGAGAPSQPAFTDAYSRQLLPLLVGEREDEVDYAAEIGALLDSLGAAGTRTRSSRFVVAENRVWRPTHHLEPAVVEVIDTLRARRAEGRPDLERVRPAGADARALRRDRAARAARCDRALGRGRQAQAARARCSSPRSRRRASSRGRR